MARYLRARYVRHRHFNRIRHSLAWRGFLAEQADRLGMTEEAVFNLMKEQGYTADGIRHLSEDPTPAAPVNTAPPVASGTPTVGQVLTVTDGTWTGNPAPDLTYQWQRDAADISGATANSYTLVADDVDANVSCVVTATNTAGTASESSNAIGPVVAA